MRAGTKCWRPAIPAPRAGISVDTCRFGKATVATCHFGNYRIVANYSRATRSPCRPMLMPVLHELPTANARRTGNVSENLHFFG